MVFFRVAIVAAGGGLKVVYDDVGVADVIGGVLSVQILVLGVIRRGSSVVGGYVGDFDDLVVWRAGSERNGRRSVPRGSSDLCKRLWVVGCGSDEDWWSLCGMRRIAACTGFWSCWVRFGGRVNSGDVAVGVLSVLGSSSEFVLFVLRLLSLLFLIFLTTFLISLVLP